MNSSVISHGSTIFFVALISCVLNNLVISRENTNTKIQMSIPPTTFIVLNNRIIRAVTTQLISAIIEDLMIK